MNNSGTTLPANFSISRFLLQQTRKLEEQLLFGRSPWIHSVRKLIRIRLPFAVHSKKYPRPEVVGRRAVAAHGMLPFDQYLQLCRLRYVASSSFVITCVAAGDDHSNVRMLMKAVSECPGIQLNIVCSGADMDECRFLLRKMRILNIHIYSGLSRNRILHLYQNSSVLLFDDERSAVSTIHPQQLEMLATGLPLLYFGANASDELQSYENVFALPSATHTGLLQRLRLIAALSLTRSFGNISRIGFAYLDDQRLFSAAPASRPAKERGERLFETELPDNLVVS